MNLTMKEKQKDIIEKLRNLDFNKIIAQEDRVWIEKLNIGRNDKRSVANSLKKEDVACDQILKTFNFKCFFRNHI